MSRNNPTSAERQLQHDLARMLVIGQRLGYTVDQCIQAVRTEQKLVQGAYDAQWKSPDTQIEDVFKDRRSWHDGRRGRPVRHRRRDKA